MAKYSTQSSSLINYFVSGKDDFKRLFYNGEHLADIEEALDITQKLQRSLDQLMAQLESCLQRVTAQKNQYAAQAAAARAQAQSAAAAASSAQSELASTPSTKKVTVKEGQPPVTVPANQEKIGALGAKIVSAQHQAQQCGAAARQLQQKADLLEQDEAALRKEKSRLEEYIGQASVLNDALYEAKSKADTHARDTVLRDIEKIEAIADRYLAVKFSVYTCDGAGKLKEKE